MARKKRTERQVIEAAICRALGNLQDKDDRPQHTFRAGQINGWTADALTSWIIQGVMRALHRSRKRPTRRKTP
jgi:hypothetical protein